MYVEIKLVHNLFFMFSPPIVNWAVCEIKNIFLHLFNIIFLTKPFNKHIICFVFEKQVANYLIILYVPYFKRTLSDLTWLEQTSNDHFECLKNVDFVHFPTFLGTTWD